MTWIPSHNHIGSYTLTFPSPLLPVAVATAAWRRAGCTYICHIYDEDGRQEERDQDQEHRELIFSTFMNALSNPHLSEVCL